MITLYDDGSLVCGSDRLDIHSYYFPFGTKSIPYSSIKRLQRIEITGPLSGQWRIWGTGNPRYWANLDLKRPRKKVGFIIDLGRHVNPIVTPDDPDVFETTIRERAKLTEGGPNKKGPFI